MYLWLLNIANSEMSRITEQGYEYAAVLCKQERYTKAFVMRVARVLQLPSRKFTLTKFVPQEYLNTGVVRLSLVNPKTGKVEMDIPKKCVLIKTIKAAGSYDSEEYL